MYDICDDSSYKEALKDAKKDIVAPNNSSFERAIEKAFDYGFFAGRKSVIEAAKKIVDSTEVNTKEHLF